MAHHHEKVSQSRAGALHGRDIERLHATGCTARGNRSADLGHSSSGRNHPRCRLVRAHAADAGSLRRGLARRRGRTVFRRASRAHARYRVAAPAGDGNRHERRRDDRFRASGWRACRRRRKLFAGRVPRADRRLVPQSSRPFLRRGHVVAIAHRRCGEHDAHHRACLDDHGCSALRLARPHARFSAALPAARVHPAAHRLDGAAQAERAALAPDRRPGLAARDSQVSGAHARRRLADARRAPAIRRVTAASTRRPRCASSSPTQPHASSRSSPRSRCPDTHRPRSRATRSSARAAPRPSRQTGACTTGSSMPKSRRSCSSRTSSTR